MLAVLFGINYRKKMLANPTNAKKVLTLSEKAYKPADKFRNEISAGSLKILVQKSGQSNQVSPKLTFPRALALPTERGRLYKRIQQDNFE